MTRRTIRCAIYTRKSSEDGLEQEFNSLHAQREACASYVASQKGEGWTLLPGHYDDGGISGGTLERPALLRLLVDIDEGRVDQVVVYKVDRLTRSLADFAKLVERLDRAGASFVSVTQSFNTATSMGRLTLNVLLSFAQFEREVTAERIRDKIAASKKKGLWMGGNVPLGYEANGRTLKINTEEAETIRLIFDLYLQRGPVRAVKQELDQRGLKTPVRTATTGRKSGGVPFGIGHLHYILSNPVYAGKTRHKDKVYDGQHEAIIDEEIWTRVQQLLEGKAWNGSVRKRRAKHPSPLVGKLFDETGDRLTPSHANKQSVRYRYYVSNRLLKVPKRQATGGWRLPALELEKSISGAVSDYLRTVTVAGLVEQPSAAEFAELQERLDQLLTRKADDTDLQQLLQFLEKADIKPGQMAIRLSPEALASALGIKEDRIRTDAILFTVPFRIRRKGVEAKFDTGKETPDVDIVLLRNVAKARRWFEMLKQGQSFAEIAEQEKLSARRIQQLMDHALLAPDITRSIIAGKQPHGLTTEYLQRSEIPEDWAEQRQLLAALND
jgi:DNA invertase Pin-like site-specific DNA recombinase